MGMRRTSKSLLKALPPLALLFLLLLLSASECNNWDGNENLDDAKHLLKGPSERRQLRTRSDTSALQKLGLPKVLLVEVHSGLGNRISTLASSAILAHLTGRVMVIDWVVDAGCGSKMTDLFKTESQPENAHALLYSKSDLYAEINEAGVVETTECDLSFTHESGSFKDFWALLSLNLYNRIHKDCDVIRLKSNIKFNSLIENSRVFKRPVYEARYKTLGSDPFTKMIRKMFNHPSTYIMELVGKFKKKNKLDHDAKWMSLHSRGFYEFDANKVTERAMECANEMIKEGFIDSLYFATETTGMQSLALSKIKPQSKLKYYHKRLVDDSDGAHRDSFELRQDLDHMRTAVAEWYLIGEAPYCAIGCQRSTYSITAILRSDCKYLPFYQADKCTSNALQAGANGKPNTEFVLDSFFQELKSSQLSADPGQTHAGVESFLRGIVRRQVKVHTKHFAKTTEASIEAFWVRDATSLKSERESERESERGTGSSELLTIRPMSNPPDAPAAASVSDAAFSSSSSSSPPSIDAVTWGMAMTSQPTPYPTYLAPSAMGLAGIGVPYVPANENGTPAWKIKQDALRAKYRAERERNAHMHHGHNP